MCSVAPNGLEPLSLDFRSDPVFAIVMAAYNRAHTIAGSIRSVLRQTHPHWMLLIVDDASTDATVEVVRRFAGDRRIQLIQLRENRGPLYARNRAWDALTQQVEWVTQLDSDDCFLPEALEQMWTKIRSVPDARFFRFASVWENGTVMGPPIDDGFRGTYRERLLGEAPAGEWVNVLHRSIIDEGWRYDERLRRGESVALWHRLARHERIYYCTDVVRKMSRATGSITRPRVKDREYYAALKDVYEVFLEQHGADLRRFSRRAYALRLKKFATVVARAGHTREALKMWGSAVRAYPFLRSHFKTLRKLLDAARSNRRLSETTG